MTNTDEKQWKQGWMVVRLRPWDMRGVFTDKEEADRIARKAGSGFEVKWGSIPAHQTVPTVSPAMAGSKPRRRPAERAAPARRPTAKSPRRSKT